MSADLLLFYLSIAVLFYCYIGYGILLTFLNGIKYNFIHHKPAMPGAAEPGITVIIAAYNEEEVLERKIINTLSVDYPADKVTIIIITDGTTDNSGTILEKYTSILWLHQDERKGKYAAVKRAMQFVKTPFVIFSDANTMLNENSFRKIIARYSDLSVGGVAGEKRILLNSRMAAVGEAEGLYWQYESFMKRLDAGFYSVVGAAGELYSIRTNLFKEMDDNLILDDFAISMQVCLQGYKIAYEPGAFATEAASYSLKEEQKRKVRIAAGAYQVAGYLKNCLNIFKYPLLSFQYISRRILRWYVCPLLLIVVFFTNPM